jgi:NAD(P)-dependent dehydrogenase (short-subunit alcohol dehydrogenase family)
MVSYSQSKLANILFTRELARRLKETNIKTFSLHPGVIASDLNRNLSGLMSFVDTYLFQLFKINTFLGCQTTLFCTLDDKINRESGALFANCEKTELFPHAKDNVAAK